MKRIVACTLICSLLALGGVAFGQGGVLEGRWEGVVRTQRGEMPASAIFIKQGDKYSGSITFLRGGEQLPFKEVKVEKDKVTAKLAISAGQRGSMDVTIRFALKGDALEGKGETSMGPQTISFTYDLKRAVELAQTAPAVAEKPQVGQARSQEELDAFNKLRIEPSPTEKIRLVGEFLKTYPESGLAAYALQDAAFAGRNLNDVEMMREYGEQSLALWPENYVLMTELASAYVQRNMVDEAEAKAELALEMLGTAAKPAQVPEDQWQQGKLSLTSTNHSTMGFVHLRRAQANSNADQKKEIAAKAVDSFKQSLAIQPLDDFTLYGIGFSFVILDDYPNAEASLAKATVMNGAVASTALDLLQDIYKMKNKNLDGFNRVLEKARKELGLP